MEGGREDQIGSFFGAEIIAVADGDDGCIGGAEEVEGGVKVVLAATAGIAEADIQDEVISDTFFGGFAENVVAV